jgi:hypothetical protein
MFLRSGKCGTRRGPCWLQTRTGWEDGYDSPMIDVLWFVVRLAADLFRSRVELVAENALLRNQLIVAQRKIVGRVVCQKSAATN